MLKGQDGDSINGPSMIATPEWLPGRLGKFYLYFAHHRGKYIRLAYADSIAGPFKIYAPGTLRLEEAPGCRDHIASPDIHIDELRQEILMYFHGIVANGNEQLTFVARSKDGIRFVADPCPVAEFYLRVVQWRGMLIGMSKGGVMYTSSSGPENLQRLARPAFPMKHPHANAPGDVRHVALRLAGDCLYVYFSRIGDAPERIYRAQVDLSRPAPSWKAENIQLVLAPGKPWEGADLPPRHAYSGPPKGPENAVRDPAVISSESRDYLLYTTSGESGIAIAELTEHP